MPDASLPPHETPHGKGTKIIVCSYVLLALTLGFMALRLILNKRWKRKLGLDDFFLLTALTLSIAQTILTQFAVTHGLGYFLRPSNIGQLVLYAKFIYSSDLLFILVLAVSKTSVICTVQRMYPASTITKRICPFLHVVVGIWTIFSMIAIAFQCHISMPWLYVPDRCVGSGALWYAVLITSIKLNLMLAFMIWPERRKLPVGTSQQRNIALLFSSRITLAIAIIIQIIFMAPVLRGENQPRQMVLPVFMRQIVMNLAVLTSVRLTLYRPVALLDQASQDVIIAKETPEPSPPTTSSSSRRFGFDAWKVNRSASQELSRPTELPTQSPRLTLNLSEHVEKNPRSVFSECFDEERQAK